MEFDYTKIKVGDTVVRDDGLQGKIKDIEKMPNGKMLLRVDYETSETRNYKIIFGEKVGNDFPNIAFEDLKSREPCRFYRIGSQVIGNKVKPDVLYEAIAKNRAERRQLSKQLWRLKNQMRPDWREQMAKKKAEAETKKDELNRKYAGVVDKLLPNEYHALQKYFAAVEALENDDDSSFADDDNNGLQ